MAPRFVVVAVVLLLLSSGPYLCAQDSDVSPTTELTSETPSAWFVELASNPTADGTSLATVRAEKDAFRKNAKAAGLKYKERRSFDVLFNGLSIEVSPAQLGKLSRISGVKNIWPVVKVERDAGEPSTPDLFSAITMTGADIAQSSLGYTGQGIKVAVMDTGIDYDNPALGGCFGPGCRVAYGWDFVGDDYDSNEANPTYNPTPVPDPDPDDCNGHGSHVAGIIGANDSVTGLKGVAPAVTFGAYRVFGCVGSTDSDIMIAAMERALADGMQVLNMSIGSGYQWPQYPTAVAATRLVNKGVAVVASIGNNGANGLYAAGAPGAGEKVIGVASVDNTQLYLPYFTLSGDNYPIGYNQATAAPAAPTSGTFPLARTGTAASTADACSALPAGSLTGKVALIRRGTCSFYIKSKNAEAAGASAVVIYNNTAGIQSITVAPTTPAEPAVGIPVVSITSTDGVLMDGRLAAGAVDLTWTSLRQSFVNPSNAGLSSSFSSYGLPPDLSFKPDITAPGGNIWSTVPLELGGFGPNSGTSMSSPHVAGAVALLLQARPNTPSQAVREILQNSADPVLWFGNPGLGLLDNVHRQGAGLLDIDDAILATTQVSPGKLALGFGTGAVTKTLSIKNKSGGSVTYDLSHVPALSTGPNTFTPAFLTGFANVTFSASAVTVPGGGTATVDVTITPNAGLANNSIYGGYIVFTPQGGGQTYRVGYAGLKGNYTDIPVMTGTTFPLVARRTTVTSYNSVASGAVFDLSSDYNNSPYFLLHFDHAPRLFRIELYTAGTNAYWHRVLQEEYVPRNSTVTGFYAFGFDGTTSAGNKTYTVPDGQYYVKFSVLRAGGDAANPAHWETKTSTMFEINRP